jgi:RimJ/RimL family protein N-acetyltransferase
MKYIGAGGVWTREQVVERIDRAINMQRDRGMTFWTVKEIDTGAIIGQGGLVPIDFAGPEIELGYRLGKDHWGNGYATEIARASAEYGFGELGLTDLVAVCYAENMPSRRVLIKAGFTEAGESDAYYGVPTIVHRLNKSDGVR